jgi:hypothetical protein
MIDRNQIKLSKEVAIWEVNYRIKSFQNVAKIQQVEV